MRRGSVAGAAPVALGLVLALALVGCGISADGAPRDVLAAEQPINLSPARSPVVADDPSATGPRVYFLAVRDDVDQVQPVRRSIASDPRPLLDALMQGPTDVERGTGINTAIPPDTRVLGAALNRGDGTLAVDVSSQFLNQDSIAVGTAVAQVVFTGTEAPGVQRVVLTVEGDPQQWYFGDRTFPEGDAMTRLDFPSLDPTEYVEPSEPPPTVPSPIGPLDDVSAG